MTQLILDTANGGLELPEVIKKAYRPWREDLGETVTMISGRMVKELRGHVWHVSYSRGWFDDATKDRVIEVCERGQETPIECEFLTPTGDTQTGVFFVLDFSYPSFQWSRDDNGETVPLWVDFAVELREVKPSD